jgi:hypothetical protein
MQTENRSKSIVPGIWILTLLVVVVFPGNAAWAQALERGFRMDPILVERTIDAGSSLSYTLTIENADSFNPLTLDVSVADVEEDLYGTYRLRPPQTTSYSLARLMKAEPERLILPPGGSRTINVTVNVPRGVAGGKYAAVVVTVAPDRSEAKDEKVFGTTRFIFQAASFLELLITGAAPRLEAYADFFKVEHSKEYPSLRHRVGDDAMVFSVGVANKSDVHVVARGELILRTMEGRVVARYPLGGGRGVILPDTTVALQSVIPRQLPVGEYQARAVIDYGSRRPVVGEVNFAVDQGTLIAQETETAEAARFIVEPAEIELNLRPGAFSSTVLEVTNRGQESIDIEGRILPLVFDVDGDLLPESERGDRLAWMEISPDSFTLAPGQTRRVRLSLRPPRDAAGGYYADVLFKSGDEGLSMETGGSLLAFVGDVVEKKGEVRITGVDQTREAVALDLLFANIGTTHLHTSAELVLNRLYEQTEADDGRIIGARSEKVGSVSVPPGVNPVLPGTERALSFMIPADLEKGAYEVLIRIDYGGEEPAITKFRFDTKGEGDRD